MILRLALAFAVAALSPGLQAWAAVARVAAVKAGPGAGFAPPWAAPLRFAPPSAIGASAFGTLSSSLPRPDAPRRALRTPLGRRVAEPAIPGVSAAPAFLAPFVPAASPRQASGGASALAGAAFARTAAAAVRAGASPGSAAGDWRRLDFASGSNVFKAGAVSPVAGDLGPASRAFRPLLSRNGGVADASAGELPAPAGGAGFAGEAPFMWGTFFNNLANSTLQVMLPIAMLEATGSLGMAALGPALTSWFDTLGTAAGGWLSDRTKPRTVLAAATALRAGAMGAAAALSVFSGLSAQTAPVLLALFAADAIGRGVADTSRRTVPLTLAGKEKTGLKRLNARMSRFSAAGAWAGPLLTGLLMAGLSIGAGSATAAIAVLPAGFSLAALLFLRVPAGSIPRGGGARTTAGTAPRKPLGGFMGTVAEVWRRPALRYAAIASALLTLMPLKSVLPAIFAEEFLGGAAYAPWLLLAIGAGRWIGAWYAGRAGARTRARGALLLSAAGTLALALGWVAGGPAMIAGSLLIFAAALTVARVAVDTEFQANAPEGTEGRLIGVQRFATNLIGDLLKTGIAAVFFAVPSPAAGLAVVSAGLAIFAAGQAVVSRAFPPHGHPGRLVVFEGLDGSGKSTAIHKLKRRLEERGIKVVLVTNNDAPGFADAFREAKKSKRLSPEAFSHAHALDLASQVHETIVPALKEGAVVLADRYYFTGIARGRARGMGWFWLLSLYRNLPRPDMVFRFKLPVETAVERVLSRSEGEVGVSDEGEIERTDGKGRRIKFYEAGLDMELDPDPAENFRLFQSRVDGVYGTLGRFLRFETVDATLPKAAVAAAVVERAFSRIGGLDGLKRSPQMEEGNPFFRDPGDDPKELRKRFMDPDVGLENFLRKSCRRVLQMFITLMGPEALDASPRVWLHGNPNLGNFAHTDWGSSLMDFDRTRRGPYGWDVVRFLSDAASMAGPGRAGTLDPAVLKAFRSGYLQGAANPEAGLQQMPSAAAKRSAPHEATTRSYAQAKGKFAKGLYKHPVSDPKRFRRIEKLVRNILRSIGREDLVSDFEAAVIGQDQGKKVGKRDRDRFIVLLKPKRDDGTRDWILLGVKETNPDDYADLPVDVQRWFGDEFENHGQRMARASAIYNPTAPVGIGWAQDGGKIFYGRVMPRRSSKFEGRRLSHAELRELAFTIGAHLGRGHALSVSDASPQELAAHFRKNFDRYAAIARGIVETAAPAHSRYLAAIR